MQQKNISTTRFDLSSPVQPNPEKKQSGKSQKNSKNHFKTFFVEKNKFCKKKEEKNAALLVFQYQEDAIRPELNSPPRFRVRGYPERDGTAAAAAGVIVAGRYFPFLIQDAAVVAGVNLVSIYKLVQPNLNPPGPRQREYSRPPKKCLPSGISLLA